MDKDLILGLVQARQRRDPVEMRLRHGLDRIGMDLGGAAGAGSMSTP